MWWNESGQDILITHHLSSDKPEKVYDKGGSRGAEDLILPGTGGAGSRPNIRGLNVAVRINDLSRILDIYYLNGFKTL